MKKTLFLACAALLMWGCANKKVVKPNELATPAAASAADNTDANSADGDEQSIRGGDWKSLPQLKAIFFDFDSSDLLPAARAALKKNADYLKDNTEAQVLIEGNCDERGTFEYNMALGERRAGIVRDYMIELGVASGRLGTISYGQEKPVDEAHNESAWAKNRRVEMKVRAGKK
jgi:peptidoglycan-associated lipoprotein